MISTFIVGKGGQKIREMQEQSGAYIKVCASRPGPGCSKGG